MNFRWIKNLFSKNGFSKNELFLLKALLSFENQNAVKLLNQANLATNISRQILSKGLFKAKIPFGLNIDNLIPFASQIDSPTLSVNLKGVKLLFNTSIEKGGYLFGLIGRTSDNSPWPLYWEDEFKIDQLDPQAIGDWIPKPIDKNVEHRIVDSLLNWLKVDANDIPEKIIDKININQPASINKIEEAEARLGCKIAPLLKQFYSISNGITLSLPRYYDIYGLDDLEIDQEIPGSKINQVFPGAIITNLYENGIVALVAENGLLGDDCFLVNPNGSKNRIGNIYDHIRDSILWKT